MFFLFWLLLTGCYLCAVRAVAPHTRVAEAQPATRGQWAIIALHYSIGLSWLLQRTEAAPQLFIEGLLFYCAGAGLALWAMASNPYFKAAIEKPPVVVRSGAYSVLDHPAYLGFCVMGAATVLMLGHPIGWIPCAAYCLVMMWRAQKENQLLAENTFQ